MAPLYFAGEIDFGVINQSSSAFNHILGDVSLVVYQVPPKNPLMECAALPGVAAPPWHCVGGSRRGWRARS